MSVTTENGKVCTILGLILCIIGPQSIYALEGGHAQEHVHGTHLECELPKSSMDIVECAMKLHPSIKRAQVKHESIENLEIKALQRPNPTLSTRFVRGDSDGQEISELEANFNFTVELGNKRGARKEVALARRYNVEAQIDSVKARVKLLTILNMHRLRQVLREKTLLDESVKAINNVLARLKKLPRLTAEQETSLTLFELAMEESKVHGAELFEQEKSLEHFFHVATGHALNEITSFLPDTPSKWPTINTAQQVSDSPQIRELKSLAQIANREYKLENSKAFPDIKIGPSYAREENGERKNEMFGFNIQLPIPIFQRNEGGRAFAKSEELRAKRNITLAKSEMKHERFERRRVYENAVKNLKSTMSVEQLEAKHKKIEKLYHRGVVSSSIYLDSFKQRLSYLKRRNQREMTALNSLWEVHLYDGKIFKEKL